MQKVSRTMLAVVAAIQSGAHTRRKVRYVRQQALVSSLYPFGFVEDALINATITHPKVLDADHAHFSTVLTASLVSTLFEYELADAYKASADFSASISYVAGMGDKQYSESDSYKASAAFDVAITKLTTQKVMTSAADNYVASADFTLNVTVS